MREIEIKLKVKDPKALEKKLLEKGCELSAPIHQHDTVYSTKTAADGWVKPKEGDVILRIRRQGGKAIFTLKQQHSHELDNTELETEVGDPEAMHRSLLLLGCTPIVEVKKIRRKGKLGEYEICLDEVEKLGSFMELEKLTGEDVDPKVVEEELFRTMEEFGLSREDQEKSGYDTQIYDLEHKS